MKLSNARRRTSIRWKLSIGIAAITLVSLAVVSAWGWWQMKSQAEHLSVQVLSEQARRNAGNAAAFIQDVNLITQGLADSREVAEAASPAEALPAARRFMEKNKTKIESVLISFPDGKRVAPDGGVADVNDRKYFQRLLKERAPLVSEIIVSRATGTLAVAVVVPWKGFDGQFKGGVWCTVPMDRLQRQTEETRFGETGYGFVINDEGVVLAHGANKDLSGKMNFSQLPDGDPLKALWKQAAESGKQITGAYNFQGKDRFAVFTPVEVPGHRNWVVGMALEQRELTGNSSKTGFSLLAVSLVLAVLAFVAAYLWARSFAAPIVRCVAAAQRIAAGDVQPLAKTIHTNDELDDLSDAIIGMNDSIRTLALDFQEKA
ncbi:MAG: cache and HAMP domain-containing protein, partial [Negativicutes bacterium]|nr:cache and HAMP domain-containing protein [Negativicutes bacterium]